MDEISPFGTGADERLTATHIARTNRLIDVAERYPVDRKAEIAAMPKTLKIGSRMGVSRTATPAWRTTESAATEGMPRNV